MASTIILGTVVAMSLAAPASAQTAPETAPSTGPVESTPGGGSNGQPNSGAANGVAEVVVTGSRIASRNLRSVSPVTVLNSQEVKLQGTTRVEDLINSLPQAFASQGSNYSNGSTGTATVSLRGLGSGRTLVLIDGRRLGPGDPNLPSADLNFIPSALVDRVEVLTGGASATYGSDAVAGVVNFIMQKNFSGVSLDAQYSLYQHNNSSFVQDILTARAAASAVKSQFTFPKGSVTDGEGSEVNLKIGVNSGDGKGNITTYATYRDIRPVLQGNRDYSGCSLNSGAVFTCGGSGTTFPARLGSFVVDINGPGNTVRPRVAATDVYNFGPTNYFQRPDTRYTLGSFAHYKVRDWADVYTDVMFMDDRSTYQIAPGGIFLGNFAINCDNPLLSAQEMTALCGAKAGQAVNQTLLVGRRNVEGGGRQGDTRHQAYRGVVGIRGDLGDAWKYDIYGQYYQTNYQQTQTGFFQTSRINNALIARRDPTTGQVVCQSVIDGSDPLCVPYNIFQIGGVTKAALNYLQVPSSSSGNVNERVVSASVTGQLGKYGIKSPLANEGVGIAFGTEYRREHLDFAADFVAENGLLNGSGGASPRVSGSFDVYELFGETKIPLIQDRPFFKDAGLELAYRYSDYSTAGNTGTYKAAGYWEPIADIRFRASYQVATRAPNVLELFSPQNVQLDGSEDPCAGLAAGDSLVAQCAKAFNLTTAQVLAIEANPSPQYNGQTGGNPNLAPETSDTFSVGAVYRPSFIRNTSLAVDYFKINVDGAIGGIGADIVVNRCVDSADPNNFFCRLVHRDAANSLFLSTDGYVTDTQLNTGSLSTSGIDIDFNTRFNFTDFGMPDFGNLTFSLVGTYLLSLETITLPGDKPFDCAGLFGGGSCGTPNPTYRHKARLSWNTPFKGVSLSGQWRFFSGVDLDAAQSDPLLSNPSRVRATDLRIPAQSYFDVSGAWRVNDTFTFRVGVNNVLDEDPPLIGASNGGNAGPYNGNTYPQVYDALGRYAFFRVTADF